MNDLESRLRRLETGINDIPTFQFPINDEDYRVQAVTEVAASSSSISARLTKVIITWLSVEDQNVERYEIWVSRIAGGADKPYLAASSADSPATFNLTSDAAGDAMAYIRTVMKNGLTLPLTASPSVTFEVF